MIPWDAKHQSEAYRVCTRINHDMAYMTDMERFGRAEFWEGGTERVGDCEEYAFAKLWALMELGWPREAFDFGIGDIGGAGHCFLIIHTSDGDKIADSNSDFIVAWPEFHVKWRMRTTGMNLKTWVAVNA